jgi:DMSO/TMAO reductase YedYZ heme-binding membrane subunit
MSAARGRFEGGSVLAACALGLAAMTALVLARSGGGEEAARALIRATAATSLTLFLLAFVASSLRRLSPRPATAWLLRNRRAIGLGFALSHAIHLAAIATLAMRWPGTFAATADAITRYGGGFGFVVVAALAATSSDAAQRRLGMHRWRALHRFGVWYVFAVFALSYGRALLHAGGYAPAAIALGAALALRLAAARTTRGTGTSSPREPIRSASR